MIRTLISAIVVTTFLCTSCNNNGSPKEANSGTGTGNDTGIPSAESIAGNGYLQLELKIDGVPAKTDSAKFVVHDIDGLRLEAWGERIPEGIYAYTYTLEMRLHSFRGVGTYPISNEYGNMFWQYKSFYINPATPGSFIADNWNDQKISGEFQFIAEDGYGDKRRVDGRFFQR